MKRAFTCFVIVAFCALCAFAQTRRSGRSAAVGVANGYYFTIGMCRACVYGEWHSDAIRLFRARGIPAFIGRGHESRTSHQPFAPISAFEMRFDPNAGSDSELLVQVELYVGPFQSQEAATRALDEFPSVLAFIQRKRDSMYGSSEGWAISDSAKVSRTSGNNYQHGFFTIKGYRIQHLPGAASADPRERTVASDFLSQVSENEGPADMVLDTLRIASGYALLGWSDENTGGEALLRFDAATGRWVLIQNTGGAYDANSLIALGVPRAAAARLGWRDRAPTLVRPPRQRRTSSGSPNYRTYIGRELNDLLKAMPDVNRRLRKLLGANYQLFMKNLTVSSELQDEQGFLKMHGLAPHMGTVEEAVFLLSFSTGKLHCAILSARFGRRYKLFSEDPNSAPTALINQLIYR